ncbi:hypothetical protein EVA_07421 [gut metagenome]|uniref:Uncharacterized protein n=1 Tax=gut metagenome TaxID=749906 RepID=J9CW48_9ZZZZ
MNLLNSKERLFQLYKLERFLPVMSPAEIQDIVAGRVDFDDASIERWSLLLENYTNESEVRLARALEKQKGICKIRKV